MVAVLRCIPVARSIREIPMSQFLEELKVSSPVAPKHYQEWTESGVCREIIEANVVSLENDSPYSYLLYSDQLARRNDGRVVDWVLRRYRHIEMGGWWCAGEDLIKLNDLVRGNQFQTYDADAHRSLWGQFKPDTPYLDEDGKPIKYEAPPKTDTRVIALHDPRRPRQWLDALLDSSVPIIIVEGAKKAGCLMTLGYLVVALPGIFNGYRKNKQDLETFDRRLIEDLQVLCAPDRPIYICFDYDQKIKTRRHVQLATTRLGKMLEQAGCAVRVIDLPGPEKGVDDFVVARGRQTLEALHETATALIQMHSEASLITSASRKSFNFPLLIKQFQAVWSALATTIAFWTSFLPVTELGRQAFYEIYTAAPTLEEWEILNYSQLTYKSACVVNVQDLGELELKAPQSARVVALKAPKGTGKTKIITKWVAEAIQQGQPTLVLTHRIQLGQALCARFGLDYVTELRDSETGHLLGYGLCVDSLHPKSGARFNANHWKNPLIIVDEAEQVIWHTLSADTEVRQHRVVVLKQLKQLIQNALTPYGHGRIVLADADLSDLSIDFVLGLAEVSDQLEPWIIRNDWMPEKGWNVFHYSQSEPTTWLMGLKKDIALGNRPFIQVSGQKRTSKWGTQNLETWLEQEIHRRFPEKRILRIDSESISDPSHEAYGCISKLNEILTQYDVVIASPSIETGVSIDIKGHFTSVWGCFQGVSSADAVRQSLSRLRDPVDRYVWIAAYGIGKIGSGATHHQSLLKSQTKVVRATLKTLLAFDQEDIDITVDPIAQRTWAKMGARINAGMLHYRTTVLAGLKAEGHTIIPATHGISAKTRKKLKVQLTNISALNQQAECDAIAAAEEVTDLEAGKLEAQRSKVPAERRKERKYKLQQRYRIDVTPDLVGKDDQGWHPQVRLHYYLSIGRDHLIQRDTQIVKKALEAGEGAIWTPDLNSSLLCHQVVVLEKLGLVEFLLGIELRNSNPKLVAFAQALKDAPWKTKAVLGITVNAKSSPITVLRQILTSKLGLRLELIRKDGPRNKQERIYRVIGLDDGRGAVFEAWLERDLLSVVTDGIDLSLSDSATVAEAA